MVELRQELEARGLDKKGVKNVLAARLQEAIDKEKATAPDSNAPSTAAAAAVESDASASEPSATTTNTTTTTEVCGQGTFAFGEKAEEEI